VRCHAYVITSEVYRELEAQILTQLRDGERDRLMYLLEEHEIDVELLSGEWRILFERASDFYQVINTEGRKCRMAISPDELQAFVQLIRDPINTKDWEPLASGLSELVDVLPVGVDMVGVVFLEEGDDWLWTEQHNELQALRPEVFSLIEGHIRVLIKLGDHVALARLCGDHCEAAIEFSQERWRLLREHCHDKAPELDDIFDGAVSTPLDYTSIREAISMVSNPEFQPSLDAWLRVHADAANYALYFRALARERD